MRRLALASAAVVALALAGCSSPSPKAAPPITTTTTTTVVAPTTIGSSPTTSTTVVSPTSAPTTTTTLPPTIGFLAQAASFVTAGTGYVMGDVTCKHTVCLAMRATANGGATWRTVTPPGPPSARNITQVSGLTFADANDGWAFGSTLWATHNGAVGWTKVGLGGTIEGLATGSGEAYALVDPCRTLTCVTPDHLERTPVGEDSWTRVPGKTALFGHGQGELVVSGTSVFVLGRTISTGAASLASSVDGAAFAALPIPCQPPPAGYGGALMPISLAAASPTAVAVVCLGDPGAGSALKQAYVSSDGGHTFTRLVDPSEGGDGAQVAMPSPSTLVLAIGGAADGVERLVAPSTTWVAALSLSDGGVGISNLAFSDPAHGYLIDGPAQTTLRELSLQNVAAPFGRLYVSVDGGASWHMVTIPA